LLKRTSRTEMGEELNKRVRVDQVKGTGGEIVSREGKVRWRTLDVSDERVIQANTGEGREEDGRKESGQREGEERGGKNEERKE